MVRVVKFGGTSVAHSENIKKVISILKKQSKNSHIVAVVSAFGGVTDQLLKVGELANKKDHAYRVVLKDLKNRHYKAANDLALTSEALEILEKMLDEVKNLIEGIFLINEFSVKTRDKVLSYGELLSSFIISEAAKKEMKSVARVDSRELIVTNAQFTKAQLVPDVTHENIVRHFSKQSTLVTILPGFVARSLSGESTTLGRGGSDYTASIVAAALEADILEIWTDVSGMFTANPKLVRQAYPIEEISYAEAMELSHFGAKVLYPPTIRPILEMNIPMVIKNTFSPDSKGTYIHNNVIAKNGPVKGISHLADVALFTLEGNGMVGVPGISKRLFEALSSVGVNVILITQASSEHSICVAINERDVAMARHVVNDAFAYEISLGTINPVLVETELSIIAVIGDGMKNHQGVSGKMFSVLGENNVNIRAIAQGASERNISAVIKSVDVKKALNTLHYRFFERQVKTLNLFIVGVGNVGCRLLEQIKRQQSYLHDHLFLHLKVVGISNSKKMQFDEDGIDLENWKESLSTGMHKTDDLWFSQVREMNLRNSVFIDITANASVAASYASYLKESIAIVACNKIACSNRLDSYQE
ncbi:MAG: aspartate kinase, partial [Bacteroidetes bacterium]|nr:aspartate kinase [Bacteroidota bacterium]